MDTTLDLLVAKMDRSHGGNPAAWLRRRSDAGAAYWTTRISARQACDLAAELAAVDRHGYTVAAGTGGGSAATYKTSSEEMVQIVSWYDRTQPGGRELRVAVNAAPQLAARLQAARDDWRR
ncbi:hypothetical protein [Frankia sp. Cj3]|uniref:hypothetical protein n=1 Tax=Frankia sp. Cj3 TaxID=2880976 RepID=UPI001EF42530|nr:hypothetical protein [Frankia sp. Cj3]